MATKKEIAAWLEKVYQTGKYDEDDDDGPEFNFAGVQALMDMPGMRDEARKSDLMHRAARSGNDYLYAYLKGLGMDIHARNAKGRTVLEEAVAGGDIKMAQVVLSDIRAQEEAAAKAERAQAKKAKNG